jgi:predicted RNA-binding protein with PUA-like domain
MYYLLKTEPSTYSFDDLVREKTTVWDGVTNPVALRNLAGMKAGDELVIYHTGDEKSAIGTASVVSVDTSNSKSPAVKIKAEKRLSRTVSLSEVKSTSEFTDSPLVRQSRLSVVPLNEKQYQYLVGR